MNRTESTYQYPADKYACLSMFLVLFSGLAGQAHAWTPGSNWQDSYAVGEQCYCNSSNYDHELDTKSARTPLGMKNVVTICNDLKSVLGTGSSNGRIPYNDIQCGHGPANNAADETGCPGRVDQGNAGCDVIGPRWNLEAVYGPWPESCSASKRLLQNQWYMVSMPCDVQLGGKGSVREVVADDLGAGGFGSTWTMYELLETGTYLELGLDSQLRSGVGYWLITNQIDQVIAVEGESPIEVDVALRAQSATGAWNMIGNPFRSSVAWKDVLIVDSSVGRVMNISQANPNSDACYARPIPPTCDVAPLAFKWTEAGVYDTLDLQAGDLNTFDAVWVLAVEDGLRIRVPIPVN